MIGKLRNLADLRRRLRPYPGHFRGLMASIAQNAARLQALRLRARLAGRAFVGIGLAERLGDVVACTPVARRVREEYPDALVVWMTRTPYVDILRDNPDIDALLEIHCLTELRWLEARARFDRAIVMHLNGHACEKCRIPLHRDNPHGVGFDNYFRLGSLLRSHSLAAGYPVEDGQPTIIVGRAAAAAVDCLDLPRRFVAVHSRSEEPRKDWNTDGWLGLANHLGAAHGLPVVEVGLRSLLGGHGLEGYVDLCGRCTPRESAEVIRRAELFVGIDSGPAHLANAMHTPGVVLFGQFVSVAGPISYANFFPYSGFYTDPVNCRVVQNDGPASTIPLEAVCEAVDEGLSSIKLLTRKPDE